MMENTVKKERKRHFDRITLDNLTLDRIDTWISQVKEFKGGVDLSRKELLNWLIQNMSETLTIAQVKELSEKFYSELRFIQYAARKIREAQSRGETLTLKDLESAVVPVKESKVRKQRKPKSNYSETNEKSDETSEALNPSS